MWLAGPHEPLKTCAAEPRVGRLLVACGQLMQHLKGVQAADRHREGAAEEAMRLVEILRDLMSSELHHASCQRCHWAGEAAACCIARRLPVSMRLVCMACRQLRQE